MAKFSAKNKIFGILVLWIILSASMFMFFFNLSDTSNAKILDSMGLQKMDLAILKAERESYKQAQADLDKLAAQPYQPENFFSRDITLVNEIQTLEDWAQKLNIKMELSGISGTINTLPKANTAASIAVIPYGISVTGTLAQVADFLQVLENLSFITNVTAVSVSSAGNGLVNANLTANFYLQK